MSGGGGGGDDAPQLVGWSRYSNSARDSSATTSDGGAAGGGDTNPFGEGDFSEDDDIAAAEALTPATAAAITPPTQPAAAATNPFGGGAAASEYDGVPFKIIVVGDSGVGKTCLLQRFVEDRYADSTNATVGVDVSNSDIDLGAQKVGLQLWDTAGQERFAPLSATASYSRTKADGVISGVRYVGKRTTLQRVKDYWLAEVLSKAAEGVTVMLVGTKADVHDELRQVSCPAHDQQPHSHTQPPLLIAESHGQVSYEEEDFAAEHEAKIGGFAAQHEMLFFEASCTKNAARWSATPSTCSRARS